MRKISNKKHSRGDNFIDNEQKPLYNKKVRSSDNGNELYPKKEKVYFFFLPLFTKNVKNDKDNSIDKDNNNDINNDMLMTEEKGALILHSYSDDEELEKGKKRLYKEELLLVKENLKLFEESLERLSERPPERLLGKENLGFKSGTCQRKSGFEKFEKRSSDNESNRKNFKKNEKKYNLDDKAVNLDKDLHKILQFIYKLPTCPIYEVEIKAQK
ncbi:hypothetical protein RhiirA1_478476 [Rhizophagus irregularis]|uniref:Uncharacterized protein n=1 Tax=Rhizophagus irregularis TaxID=588596 RepID=A0A2N0QRZ7_9GLOM|nr:hypothetical protein RhiirA1_478476 [Rhizophagus irregularis]